MAICPHAPFKGGMTNHILNPDQHYAYRYRTTHPACSLKHFEVQRVSRQLALYFGKRVAGGHTSHKLGLDKIFLVGSFL